MSFGPVLKQMRKNANMSQEELAEELHIARSSISKLERDQLELKAVDLLSWANVTQSQDIIAALALGVDVVLLQQALEIISTMTAGFISGGIL